MSLSFQDNVLFQQKIPNYMEQLDYSYEVPETNAEDFI